MLFTCSQPNFSVYAVSRESQVLAGMTTARDALYNAATTHLPRSALKNALSVKTGTHGLAFARWRNDSSRGTMRAWDL